MKYLLLIGIVLGVLWLLRQQRGQAGQGRRRPPRPAEPPPPTEIVACTRCSVHLPRAEAVAGERGHYCSASHRQEAEGG